MRKTDRLIVVEHPDPQSPVWFTGYSEPVTFAFRPPSSGNGWFDVCAGLRAAGHVLAYAVPIAVLEEGGPEHTLVMTHVTELGFDTVFLVGCRSVWQTGIGYLEWVTTLTRRTFQHKTSRRVIPIIDNQNPHGRIVRIPARTWRHVWPVDRYQITRHTE